MSGNKLSAIRSSWTACSLQMGRMCCSETSITRYQPTPRHVPEDRSPLLINHSKLSSFIHDRSDITSRHLSCKLARMNQSMKWPGTAFVPEIQLSAGTCVFLFADAFIQSLLTNQPHIQITAGCFHNTRTRSTWLTTLLHLLTTLIFFGSLHPLSLYTCFMCW